MLINAEFVYAGLCPLTATLPITKINHFRKIPDKKYLPPGHEKDAGACPGGDRRAHFGGEMFPGREIAAAWARRGGQLWTEGAGRCRRARKGSGGHERVP